MQTSLKKYSVVLLALGVALFSRLFLISIYKIPTESMMPTFLPGDYIVASQISYGLKFPWSESTWFKAPPQKGDLIVFAFKSKPAISYIKRVAGVEGDEVETNEGLLKVGPGQVYVLSDNRQVLDDSRDLGLVSIEQIESQAKLIWFSFAAEGTLAQSSPAGIRWKRILTQLK